MYLATSAESAVDAISNTIYKPAVLVPKPLTQLELLFLVVVFLAIYLVSPAEGNVAFRAPFVGSRYAWLARIGFFFSAESILRKGHSRHRNTPWKLCGNDVIVLPHRYLEEIRKLPLSQASAMQANLDNMQSSYTHLDVLNKTRLFVQIIKTKLTPQLGILVPTIRKELDSAFKMEMPTDVSEIHWTSLEVFETFHRIIGRVSARIFGGKELRDDPTWLNTAEAYLNNIFKTAIAIRLIPSWAKFVASFFLPCSWEISYNAWKAKRILIPYIRHRQATVAQRAGEIAKTRKEEFPDLLQYLIEKAEGPDTEPMCLASMVLSLSLASNHTTSMALTEALYDLCTHPEYIPELREEIQTAITSDSGWQKTTLTKMQKLDSFIKESQRMHPPSLMGYKRKIKTQVVLSDGLVLPAGAHIEFAIVPIQQDNTEHPEKFDALRFYRMRQTRSEAHKHQFATTSPSSLHFGHGQNSCPGRFMASNVIKMVLGTLLIEYDFKLKEGPGRPRGISAFEYNFPNPTAHLLIRKRKVA